MHATRVKSKQHITVHNKTCCCCFLTEREGQQANAKAHERVDDLASFCQVKRKFHDGGSNHQPFPWELGVSLPSSSSLGLSRTINIVLECLVKIGHGLSMSMYHFTLHKLVMSIFPWVEFGTVWLETVFSTNGVESIQSWCELELGCIWKGWWCCVTPTNEEDENVDCYM